MEKANTPLVLIVDDEAAIVEMVKTYLEGSGFKTICAHNGKDALAGFAFFSPDIALLDLMLPDISGEALCRTLREKSNIPVIMLTAKADEESIVQALGLGADDYITKPFSLRELLARVRAALRRAGVIDGPPPRLISGPLSLDTENRRVEKDGELLPLTYNEYKILLLFMSHPEKVFTREEIIDKVKGDDFDGFDRSIDTHIKNLRRKIGDGGGRRVFIQTVYGMGYRFTRGADDTA
jgi:DNA-binding response OmpR family regulator